MFVAAGASFESNESLGLLLRSQGGVHRGLAACQQQSGAVGDWRRARGQRRAKHRRGTHAEPGGRRHVQAVVLPVRSPETNVDVAFQYYPSLSNWGRQRIQLDASAKREVWKDVFLSVNAFDTFDSRPPNESAERNDVGVVLSFGWSY